MSFAQALALYLNLNLMLMVSFAGLSLFSQALRFTKSSLGSRPELRLHYFVLSSILFLTVIQPLLPSHQSFLPAVKVWSAQSSMSFNQDDVTTASHGYLSLPTPKGQSMVRADRLAIVWATIGLMLFVFSGVWLGRDIRALLLIANSSVVVRRLGHVRIYVSDVVRIPFSYWLPGQASVVLPASLVERRGDCQMVMAHELQHHRQGDTRWVYLFWGLRMICVVNPVVHFWSRWISEIQEFACDETLIDRKKVESQAYARCLVEVAQSAIDQKFEPVCATGLTFLVERNLLKRRIQKMLNKSSARIDWKIGVVVSLLLLSVMGATTFASKGLIQDRRVNMAEAQIMADRAQQGTSFPVVLNDLVLKQLNRYIGTPEGRKFMRAAMAQMENYKNSISENLQKYGLPGEILAVPIIESGYRNLPEREGPATVKSAGLWQFIPSTARNFGLRVDKQKDERLDVGLSTDAALRYLQANNLRFKDWHLAALAYNMGERAVQNGMNALDSRNAWTLIRNGYEGDKDYLPKLIAAVLILRNPESVE